MNNSHIFYYIMRIRSKGYEYPSTSLETKKNGLLMYNSKPVISLLYDYFYCESTGPCRGYRYSQKI